MSWRIHLSPPHLGGDERDRVIAALDSNWIAPVGPDLDAFESEVAERTDRRFAVGLVSGTAGIHLGLLALGVSPGDEVVVPTLTFAATANPVVYLGARPVFVDADPGSWQLDTDRLATLLQDRGVEGRTPAAVVPVDLYGQTPDHDAVGATCAEHDVAVLEDAAEGLGATYRGRPAGAFGAAAVVSFNGNKIITTSGGGMLVTDDEHVARRVRHLATQAREAEPHYEHVEVGFNYRLSNILAALGRGQLAVLDDHVARRRDINARYRAQLEDVAGVTFMPDAGWGEPTWWLTCLTVDPDDAGADRDAVRLALAAADIEARPVWKPMHLQPVFAEAEVVGGATAEALFREGLCLPSGSSLTDDDVDEIVDRVRQALPAA